MKGATRMTHDEIAAVEEAVAIMQRVATHVAETLYYNSDHLAKNYSGVIATKFIRHDDYDELRAAAKRLKAMSLRAQLAEIEKSA